MINNQSAKIETGKWLVNPCNLWLFVSFTSLRGCLHQTHSCDMFLTLTRLLFRFQRYHQLLIFSYSCSCKRSFEFFVVFSIFTQVNNYSVYFHTCVYGNDVKISLMRFICFVGVCCLETIEKRKQRRLKQ